MDVTVSKRDEILSDWIKTKMYFIALGQLANTIFCIIKLFCHKLCHIVFSIYKRQIRINLCTGLPSTSTEDLDSSMSLSGKSHIHKKYGKMEKDYQYFPLSGMRPIPSLSKCLSNSSTQRSRLSL